MKKAKAVKTAKETLAKPELVVLNVKKILDDNKSWGTNLFQWPYKDNSVSEATVADVLEYIPGKDRGRFMDELYRVLIPGGVAKIVTRYWSTSGSVQDYRYEWPPITEASFLYFNKGWREANKLELGIVCDFDFTYGYQVDQETASRSDEVRSFNLKNYTNVVQALNIQLTKRLPTEFVIEDKK